MQPRVAEPAADRRPEPAEARPAGAAGRPRAGSGAGRAGSRSCASMKCGISTAYSRCSQSTKPSNAAASTLPQVRSISLAHRVAAGADQDRAAVGEAGPVRRVEPAHRQQVEVGVDRAQGVGDQVGHGQHRRAGVEGEAVLDQQPGPAARDLLPLDHGDRVPAAGEVAGGRQPGQAGPDDDDLVHRHPARRSGCAIWVSPAHAVRDPALDVKGGQRGADVPADPRLDRVDHPARRQRVLQLGDVGRAQLRRAHPGQQLAGRCRAAAPRPATRSPSACRTAGRRRPACRCSRGSPQTPSRSSRRANASPTSRP